MKKVLFFALSAAMFAACSNTEELGSLQTAQQDVNAPVNFSVYAPRTATRAGLPGGSDLTATDPALKYGINTASLQSGRHASAGFGVFGYYTSNSDYDTNNSTPNFMYNQQVVYDNTKSVWNYEPVKYWPNEFGDAAVSDDLDKLTFFAYAPQIDATINTGVPVMGTDDEAAVSLGFADKAAWDAFLAGAKLNIELKDQVQKLNITQLTKNTATGDPIVKYVVDTKPATSVDLLWGVAGNSEYEGMNGKTVKAGDCYIDLTKQKGNNSGVMDKKLMWNFKHALARLNVQIVTAVDVVTAPGGNAVDYDPTKSYEIGSEASEIKDKGNGAKDDSTKVYVRSIKFSGFALKGALNLHSDDVITGASDAERVKNAQPKWMDYDGTKDLTFEEVTFLDGLKDGKEGTTDNVQKNEGISALNPILLEESTPASGIWGAKKAGVPTDAFVNLFAGSFNGTADDPAAPIYVIPANEKMDVTICYDVQTADKNLSELLSDGINHGSAIENIITKNDVFNGAIEPGKAYTLKIILGLESVKFDVEVTNWDVQTDAATELPANE